MTERALATIGTGAPSALPATSQVYFSPATIDLFRRSICKDATPDELGWFLATCRQMNLDPRAHQIYFIKESSGRIQIQVSIAGLRAIAKRTRKYAGQVGPHWCGPDGIWKDVWLSDKPPAAARVGILHRDFSEPIWGTALWKSFARLGSNGKKTPWDTMGEHMLAIRAEGIAFKRGFPNETAGVEPNYGDIEQDEPPVITTRTVPARAINAPARANGARQVDTTTGEIYDDDDVDTSGAPIAPPPAGKPASKHFAAAAQLYKLCMSKTVVDAHGQPPREPQITDNHATITAFTSEWSALLREKKAAPKTAPADTPNQEDPDDFDDQGDPDQLPF